NQLRACPESEFRACLGEYFPQALKLFSDISCGGSLEFLEAFPTREEALGGTAPITKSSGSYSHTQFRFSCNKGLRNTLSQFAFTSITKSIWARSYYKKKRKEGKTKSHALRCLANAWVKVIFAIWIDNSLYDENLHFASV
ncbi:MAG: transposase, partial [Thermodesulfobacteriota bacterium]